MPEAFRGRHRPPFLLIAILLAALGVRLLALAEIRGLGFFTQPLSDARVYVNRARGIAAGDWLGPTDFVHAPLYAYFLATIGGPSDDYVWAPRVAQILLGVVTVALVYETARRLFGGTPALLAALLFGLYAPAIFFDLLIQKAGLTLALAALVLATATWAHDATITRSATLRWGLAGVALGLLILNRQHALIYLPLLAAWAALAHAPRHAVPGREAGSDSAPPTRLRVWPAAALTIVCILVLAPWVARNRAVLGEWVLTTPNLGQNFAMGVGPHATGTYRPARSGFATGEREQRGWTREAQEALGRSLTPREVSAYYLDAALAWIRNHPLEWLRQFGRKIALTWAAYELPDTEDFYLYQEHSRVLAGLGAILHFGVLAPLAAAGVVLSLAAARRLWPLYLWLILTTLSIALFVVFARYRLPLIPVLAVFAGHGAVELVRRVRERLPARAGVALAAGAVVAVAVNGPASQPKAPPAFARTNHAIALADAGRHEPALAELDRALALAPRSVDVHQALGSVLLEVGRYADAFAHYRVARDGDPAYAAAWRGMGDALVGLERNDEALPHFREAVRLDPDDAVSRSCLGAALARAGELDGALAQLEEAARLAPDYAEAHLNRGNTLLALGRPADAQAAYLRAIELRPDYVDAWFNRGVLAAQTRAYADAATCFEAVLRTRPTHALAQRALIESLLAAGHAAAARSRVSALLEIDPNRADLIELRSRIDARASQPRP